MAARASISIARFRLGFAPDARSALKAALLAKGFKAPLLLQAGLIVKPEDGRESFDFDRTFSARLRSGRPFGPQGRAIGEGLQGTAAASGWSDREAGRWPRELRFRSHVFGSASLRTPVRPSRPRYWRRASRNRCCFRLV